jgi:hypothetical protein
MLKMEQDKTRDARSPNRKHHVGSVKEVPQGDEEDLASNSPARSNDERVVDPPGEQGDNGKEHPWIADKTSAPFLPLREGIVLLLQRGKRRGGRGRERVSDMSPKTPADLLLELHTFVKRIVSASSTTERFPKSLW